MKTVLLLFSFLVIFPGSLSCTILAQDIPVADLDNIGLTRSRLLFGYSGVIMKDAEPMFRNLFFNVNYRTSKFDQFTKAFRLNFASEVGLNGVMLREKDSFGSGSVIPYVKIGPEMSLGKNVFVGGSIGLAVAFIGYFGILPYAGINSYYLLPLNDDIFVEFEGGFHTSFVGENTPYMIYLASGIAIK